MIKETIQQLTTIKKIFLNNKINIDFSGVEHTPFITKINIKIDLDYLNNINKIKICQTADFLLRCLIILILFFNDNNSGGIIALVCD